MRSHQIGGPYYEHDLWWQILKDVIDGVKIRQVFLSQLFPLVCSDAFSNFFVAVD